MPARTLLIACEVVARELSSRIGQGLPVRLVDSGLHAHPDLLRTTLQQIIDQEEDQYETLVLGFGLCSRAVEGLKSKCCQMVFPLVDDCIGLFLGSRTAHLEQLKLAPGTFFLSRGWVDKGLTPFREYKYMLERFGAEKADRIMKALLKNYTRLAFIDMGQSLDSGCHRAYARSKALEFGLEYKEIDGSTVLFDELLNGRRGGCLKVVPAGEEIRYEMFLGAKI